MHRRIKPRLTKKQKRINAIAAREHKVHVEAAKQIIFRPFTVDGMIEEAVKIFRKYGSGIKGNKVGASVPRPAVNHMSAWFMAKALAEAGLNPAETSLVLKAIHEINNDKIFYDYFYTKKAVLKSGDAQKLKKSFLARMNRKQIEDLKKKLVHGSNSLKEKIFGKQKEYISDSNLYDSAVIVFGNWLNMHGDSLMEKKLGEYSSVTYGMEHIIKRGILVYTELKRPALHKFMDLLLEAKK